MSSPTRPKHRPVDLGNCPSCGVLISAIDSNSGVQVRTVLGTFVGTYDEIPQHVRQSGERMEPSAAFDQYTVQPCGETFKGSLGAAVVAREEWVWEAARAQREARRAAAHYGICAVCNGIAEGMASDGDGNVWLLPCDHYQPEGWKP